MLLAAAGLALEPAGAEQGCLHNDLPARRCELTSHLRLGQLA